MSLKHDGEGVTLESSLAVIKKLAKDPAVAATVVQILKSYKQAISPEVIRMPWSARIKHLPVLQAIVRFEKVTTKWFYHIHPDHILEWPLLIAIEMELALSDGDVELAEKLRAIEGWKFEAALTEYSRVLEWTECRGVLYEFTPALATLMMNTDVPDDFPIKLVRLPYQMISLRQTEGGTLSNIGLSIPGKFDIDEILLSRKLKDETLNTEILGISVLGPGTKTGAGLSSFMEMNLTINGDDDDTPLAKRVTEVVLSNQDEVEYPFSSADWTEFIIFVLKILLYITVPNARCVNDAKLSDLIKSASEEKNPQKKESLLKSAKRAYDRIVIGPEVLTPAFDDFDKHQKSHREVSTHWRRGHYKAQRYGVARSLVRTIFIDPVIVRGDRLTVSESIVPKDYLVKGLPNSPSDLTGAHPLRGDKPTK